MAGTTQSRAGAVLGIDLAAIVANWRLLRARAGGAECAAVVKADAYGLGAAQVGPALAAAGCRVFFVATLDEGIALRAGFAQAARSGEGVAEEVPPAAIFVLNGAAPGYETELLQHGLMPVLNSLGALEAWGMLSDMLGVRLPAALHVDTGMSRLGLPPAELATLAAEPERLDGVTLTLVLSHPACADDPSHELNRRQRDALVAARSHLPTAPASFANSSAIFLGDDYVFDMVRPGAALYGVAPVPGTPNPMNPVVRLDARILQVREIDSGMTVGYGASHRTDRRSRIATVGVGYADGLPRSLGNRGSGYIGDHRVPLVGRVSMDLITFDVTDVAEDLARPGATIELLGARQSVDDVAAAAGTIGYEILTSLGTRYARRYDSAGL